METVLNYKKDIGRSFGLTALLAILIILLCLWITSFITSLFFKIMLYLFAFSCFVILLMSIVRVSRRLGGKPAVRINSEGLFIHNSLSGKWKKIEWGDIVKIDYPDNMELRQRLSYMKIQLIETCRLFRHTLTCYLFCKIEQIYAINSISSRSLAIT